MTEIEIKILGSGREVGRAAIALGSNSKYLLLDHGVNFGDDDVPQLPLHIRPGDVDGLVVTHSHLDHIGASPLLYTSARIPAVMTRLTKALAEIMIKDFIKISGYYLPFEYMDLEEFLSSTLDVDYDKEVKLGNFTVRLYSAGHIPGSAVIHVEVNNVKILYTGDINTVETRLVEGADLNNIEADILIIEGTYGDSVHPDRKEVENSFIEAVKEVIEEGGNVLIPAFSLGRSQEIMSLLYEKLNWVRTYYDGMVRTINNVLISYPEYINRYDLLTKAVKDFKMVRSSGERRRIVKRDSQVIIASAGMLKGGPAQYYAKKMMDDPNNAIFLVSYQGINTPGRRLLEEGRILEDGDLVKAKVRWFDFSSHAGYDGLLNIIKSVKNLSKIVLVHSDEAVGLKFVERIKEIKPDVDIYFPLNGETLRFDL
jgi:putative mRNA 3-end processing factor